MSWVVVSGATLSPALWVDSPHPAPVILIVPHVLTTTSSPVRPGWFHPVARGPFPPAPSRLAAPEISGIRQTRLQQGGSHAAIHWQRLRPHSSFDGLAFHLPTSFTSTVRIFTFSNNSVSLNFAARVSLPLVQMGDVLPSA